MSENKEWNLNSGEPELFNYFGQWEKRKTAPNGAYNSASLYKLEDITIPEPEDVGSIFLRELKKNHTIEDGFSIKKVQDLIISVESSNVDCQMLIIKTPWDKPKQFIAYSPKTPEGFQKFASKIRGGLKLGEQGTPSKPQPYWSWNTLTVDGLDSVETMGPPIMVEYMGNQYFDYLANFFKRGKF